MELKEKALEAIANEKRRKVLHLLEDGDKNFTEIQKTLGVDKSSLMYHIKKLVSRGLVANIYERRAQFDSRCYSYYKLTSFGAYVMDWYRVFEEKPIKSEQRKTLIARAKAELEDDILYHSLE